MIFTGNIEYTDLDIWIEQNKIIQLIDITEENLMQHFDVNAEWIPAQKFISEISRIPKDKPVILCCQRGNDSFILMNILHAQYHFTNVLSLKSGIYGWKSLKKL